MLKAPTNQIEFYDSLCLYIIPLARSLLDYATSEVICELAAQDVAWKPNWSVSVKTMTQDKWSSSFRQAVNILSCQGQRHRSSSMMSKELCKVSTKGWEKWFRAIIVLISVTKTILWRSYAGTLLISSSCWWKPMAELPWNPRRRQSQKRPSKGGPCTHMSS
jgi:hypothetical protein